MQAKRRTFSRYAGSCVAIGLYVSFLQRSSPQPECMLFIRRDAFRKACFIGHHRSGKSSCCSKDKLDGKKGRKCTLVELEYGQRGPFVSRQEGSCHCVSCSNTSVQGLVLISAKQTFADTLSLILALWPLRTGAQSRRLCEEGKRL